MSQSLECGNLLVNEKGLMELDQGRVVRLIPKEKISRISLHYGCAANRPLLEAITAGVVCAFGLWALYQLLTSLVVTRLTIGAFALSMIGVAMVVDVVRKHHYLLVKTDNDAFKLKFSSKATRAEIESFCRALQETWGYEVNGLELAEMPMR